MPKLANKNYQIVKYIEKINPRLPILPPEIWMIIFEIRDEIIEYENSLSFEVKWNMGWRPKNYQYKTADWIVESKQKYWLDMSIIVKILWKLNIIEVDKLEYWEENPGWNSILFNNTSFT